jgi:hypothetical protein
MSGLWRDAELAQNPGPVVADKRVRAGHYRWIICALLFFATTIN